MEQAFETLMREAEGINEDDPRQMASLMRKFTSQTGLNLGDAMEEAISRMEAGEDPDQIEKEMGEVLGEDDFSLEVLKKKARPTTSQPIKDDKLVYAAANEKLIEGGWEWKLTSILLSGCRHQCTDLDTVSLSNRSKRSVAIPFLAMIS